MSENTTGDRAASADETEAAEERTEAPGADSPPGTRIAGLGEDAPPIPDEIHEAARLAPDHWLGMVDPTWSGEGAPPDWATVGRWRSSPEGEVVEWQDNPDYKPSPRALGWPEPEDDVDAAVQLAATGYGPGDAVPKALADYEAAFLTSPGGGLLSVTTPEGAAAVPLYTSPVFLHSSGRFGFELMRVDRELLGRVPEGHLLYLNPSAPVSMTLEASAVRAVLDGTSDAGETEDGEETGNDAHTENGGGTEDTGGTAPWQEQPAPMMITTSSDSPAVSPSAPSDDPGDPDERNAEENAEENGGQSAALDGAAQAEAILSGEVPRERGA